MPAPRGHPGAIFEHTGGNVYSVTSEHFTIGPFNASGTPAEVKGYVMDAHTDKETAAIYARKSTADERKDGKSESVERQVVLAKEFARRQGGQSPAASSIGLA